MIWLCVLLDYITTLESNSNIGSIQIPVVFGDNYIMIFKNKIDKIKNGKKLTFLL